MKMKNGVYVNFFNDFGNLLIVKNGKVEDGDQSLSLYNFSLKFKKKTMTFLFKDLEYLGKL